MPRVGVRRIEGAGWDLDPKRYEKAFRKVMNDKAKPAVLKMMKEVVQGKRYSNTGAAWKHKVQFRATLQIRGGDLILYAFPAGENEKYWNWTGLGTRPHKIKAKPGGFLVFPYGGPGQAPKTRTPRGSGGSFGGPGVTKWAKVAEVDHPGTKARRFGKRITKEYVPIFRRLIRRTIEKVIMEERAHG